MRVHVASVRVETRAIDLPTRCPCCDTPVTPAGVVASIFVDASYSLSEHPWAPAIDDLEPGGALDAPHLYQCRECSHVLGGGATEYPPLPPELPADQRCDPDCRGWGHFNVGSMHEGIQRCDECQRFLDDDQAARAHALHCRCGAGVDIASERCHACGEPWTGMGGRNPHDRGDRLFCLGCLEDGAS